MDQVVSIFAQLGVDQSVFKLFALVVILFIVIKFMLMTKLQFIIEKREEKTVKLEGSADSTFEKIQKLNEEYKAKIQTVQIEAQKIFNEEKESITRKNDTVYKNIEKEMESFLNNSRKEMEKDINDRRNEVLSKSNELADQLVNKLIQIGRAHV
jgi:F0F1-type ATP synthase membrane subunit b/b'